EDFMMFELPDDAIGIYHRMFDFSGFRIPFSSFLLALIKHYKVYFSQLGPLDLNKVITFEVLCRSLQIEPIVTLFRVYQNLCKQGDWFSFAKHCAPSPVCIDDNRSCIKHWKSGFFFIDRQAILDVMVLRHLDAAIDYPRPTGGSFNMFNVRRLSVHVIKLRDMPEGVLVLSRLSRVWMSCVCDPVLWGADGNEDLAVGTPSSKIVAKAEASRKLKASTSGATSSHVTKRTVSWLNHSVVLLVLLCLWAIMMKVITRVGAPLLLLLKALTPEGKGIMVDDVVAPPYYATYLEDGVAENYEFTREEWDAPYQPTFRVLIKEVFKVPTVCKTIVDQFHTLREMVSRLNDKLSSFNPFFAKSKAKGKERKKNIKSLTKSLDNLHTEVARLSAALNQGLVRKFLASDKFSRVQGELLSLAASVGFERGLSMHRTKDEFVTVLKKMVNFMPGAQDGVVEASYLVAQTNYAFLNKISEHAIEPLSESTVIPASKSLELSANVDPTNFVVASKHNKEMVSAEVDGSDPKMTDDTINVKFGHDFMHGMFVVLDDAVELAGVGSGYVSSGPNDVVVSLSAGEKGDGLTPFFVTGEEAVVNPSRVYT
nr:hypothetical protein [Tanacetum cinerariifolium]